MMKPCFNRMAESQAQSISSMTPNGPVTFIQVDADSPSDIQKEEEEAEKVVEVLLTDVLICSLCSHQFHGIVEFLAHKSGHTMFVRSYQCELCKSKFSRQAALLNHYKKKHRIVLEAPSPPVKKSDEVPNRDQRARRTMGFDELMLPNNSVNATAASTSSSSDGADNMGVGDDDASTVPVLESNVENNASADVDQEVPLKSSDSFSSEQDFNFILQTEVVKGKSMEYGVASFKCLHCDYKTEARTAMTAHMKSWHSDLLSLNQSIATRPMVSYLSIENQKLISMSQYEASYGELRLKKKTHDARGRPPRPIDKQDMPGIFPCPKCDKVFSRTRYLKKHSPIHSPTQNFTCDQCGKTFKSRPYLTVHKKTHKEKLFQCTQCDFKSNIKTAIHQHRQLHSQGSVLCDICGYAYNDKSTLAKHKRVHDPSRPFPCTFLGCTWRFKTEAMSLAHVRGHTTEGKFKCKLCGHSFRHKHHLQRHEAQMHGIQRPKRIRHSDLINANMTDTISFVVSPDLAAEQFQTTLSQHQLVVATDGDGTPIAIESADLTSLTNVLQYQALIQNSTEAQSSDGKTLDLTAMDGSGNTVLLCQE
ncbi:zinc finger protein 729-like [Lineus longissimus]|uniref:zinc finger protein 729-like n=1 Tax=Lineus longissimus TaxID=88925 RepID=UPI00315DF0F7